MCFVTLSISLIFNVCNYLLNTFWSLDLEIHIVLLIMPMLKLTFGMIEYVKLHYTRRNVVHSNHKFVTTMQLVSKPINFTTIDVLIFHVTVVASVGNHICNYMKGQITF
jgi:hypothetical protein